MSGLVLVADDLTGALDSAVSFCGSLGPIPVCLGATQDPVTEHAAFDLATRDATAGFAVEATLRIAPRMAGAGTAYKKIDSLLRGHWAIELAALIGTRAFGPCILAPAFPSQGRTTLQGRQWVCGSDGAPTLVAVDPAEALERLGLRVAKIGVSHASQAMACDADVMLCDAAGDDDLRRIVGGVSMNRRADGPPVLWCGSAGLARALAGQVPPCRREIEAPVLSIIGTAHPVSRAQIAHALTTRAASHVVMSVPVARVAERIAERIGLALGRSGACLLTFDFPDGTPAGVAADAIGQGLRGVLPAIPRPASLLVAGGETLLSVCRAVGASHLEVNAEHSPGVPRSRLCGGWWQGVDVVSKSGGFGHAQWLSELMPFSPLNGDSRHL
ncbi:MAG: hypothetical protein JWP52_4221 [Rhizobacter sp.]|nr:hypothetical protein [Rhizobacter sp.]